MPTISDIINKVARRKKKKKKKSTGSATRVGSALGVASEQTSRESGAGMSNREIFGSAFGSAFKPAGKLSAEREKAQLEEEKKRRRKRRRR